MVRTRGRLLALTAVILAVAWSAVLPPTAAADGLVRVIVRLRGTPSTLRASTLSANPDLARAQLRTRRVEAVDVARSVTSLLEHERRVSFGTSVQGYEVLWTVRGVSATCSADLVDRLAALPDVAEVLTDPFLEVKLPDATSDGTAPWHLAALRGGDLAASMGLDGTGVTVGILDSGCSPDAPFAGRVAAYRDFRSEPSPEWGDDVGHGTAVAGCVVHESLGVAPGARLVVARVIETLTFHDEAGDRELVGAFAGRILAAMQWMLDPDEDPATADAPLIVSNSWGFPENPYLSRDYFRPAVAAWRSAGLIPVFAAGNVKGQSSLVVFPADYPDVIAVGAHDRGFAVPAFSCGGSPSDPLVKPDFVAPGDEIPVFTRLRSGRLGVTARRGTSFAAPLVAGLLAVLAQASPGLAYDGAYGLLRDGARDLETLGRDRRSGWGAVNLDASLARLLDAEAWADGAAGGLGDAARVASRWSELAGRAGTSVGAEILERFRQNVADAVAAQLQTGESALATELSGLLGPEHPLASSLRRVAGFAGSVPAP